MQQLDVIPAMRKQNQFLIKLILMKPRQKYKLCHGAKLGLTKEYTGGQNEKDFQAGVA
jgi:hypothetical protein